MRKLGLTSRTVTSKFIRKQSSGDRKPLQENSKSKQKVIRLASRHLYRCKQAAKNQRQQTKERKPQAAEE